MARNLWVYQIIWIACFTCCMGSHCTIHYDRSSEDTVRVAAILPSDPVHLASASRISPAVALALKRVQISGLLPGRTWDLHYHDSQCKNEYGLFHAVRAYTDDRVHLFLGPVCDYVTAPVARMLKFWDIPLLTGGALARDYGLDKTSFDTEFYLLTRTGLSFNGMTDFILRILARFDWWRVLFFYESDAYARLIGEEYCVLCIKAIVTELRDAGNFTVQPVKIPQRTKGTMKEFVRKHVGTDYAAR